ncbi:MFS transporter (macronuclear) [Tetrahymena thermophila SB210]|uniref:MFS transporter n=1 Tax=Tetrahymena thermophila (strain SB210) TaxID=312017 RepID=Q233C7_TETTS|nr:MFS transporter [Tetrahymena thermophila SB210]EAR91653.2 MFS transporter [Tetrahymena thermophila SB210]|eukprot:XP_001011898.2 MFS transporter [Tetrahymena thermophila SB210]
MYDKKKTKISELSNRLLNQNEVNESYYIEKNNIEDDDEDENNQNDKDYDSDHDEDEDEDDENSQQKKENSRIIYYNQRVNYSKMRDKSHQDIRIRPSLSLANYLNDSYQNKTQSYDQVKINITSKKFSFEQFLEKVGTENWYQIRLFSCFCLQWFVVGWFMISQNFLFQKVKYVDHYSQTQNVEDLCQNGDLTMEQTGKLLLPNQFNSITVEFNLYCKNDNLRQFFILFQPFFGILGYSFFGYLSDNFGRKHALKLAWKIFIIGQIVQCFTKVLPLVISGYSISAFAALSVIILQISLINEQATGYVRVLSGIGLNVAFSAAQAIFTAFAYIIHDWRILMIVCGVFPTILLNFLISTYEESPRFYYLKNKQKALRMLNKIAIVNGKKSLNVDLERSTWNEEWKEKNRKYKDLFQYLSVRLSILAGSMIFFCTEMLFKAGELTLEKGTLTTYVKVVVLSLSDVFASIVAMFIINKLKRKKQLYISCTISAIFIILFYLYTNLFTQSQIKDSKTITFFQILIVVISRFSSNYLRTVAFVYFAELFPTVVRSMGMAVLFASSQLGSIVVYLMQIRQFNDILYLIPIAFCSLICLVHIFWIPNIQLENQPIRDEIPEIAFGHEDQFYLDETEDQ